MRIFVAALLAASVSPLFAVGSAPHLGGIVILNAKAVESNAMERIATFARQELSVPVTVVEVPAITCTNLDDAIPSALQLKKPEYACIIALITPTPQVGLHAVFRTNIQVAIVNVTAMRSDDARKTEIRIGKQVMRAAGFLFGLPPSLDPFCVMRDYQDLDDLDSMGRNFFPPWQFKFQEAVQRCGIPLADADPARPPETKTANP